MSRPDVLDVPAPVGRAAPSAPTPRRRRPPPPLTLAVGLQAAVSAGDGLAMVALANRVFAGSGASWAVAAVFLAVCIPITVLAPPAGLLLDRLPTRPVLVAAAAASAVVALALSRTSDMTATLVLATGFGVCAAVLQPGLGAIVPRLAGDTGVTRANSYLQAATWAGFTVGPLLAGALTVLGGSGLALLGDGALYVLGALGLAALRLTPPASRRALDGKDADGKDADGKDGSLAAQLRAGLDFLRADREAALLVTVVAVMVAFANLGVVAEVAFAEHVLHSGQVGYSVLVAAWTAGMVAGTLAGGRLPRRWLVAAALAGTVVTGVGVALAGTAAMLWQASAAYAVGGLADGLEVVATRSFLNHRAPAAASGRVFALYSGLLFGASSVGMAAAGGLLGPLGARRVLLLAGIGTVATGATGWLWRLRRTRRG